MAPHRIQRRGHVARVGVLHRDPLHAAGVLVERHVELLDHLLGLLHHVVRCEEDQLVLAGLAHDLNLPEGGRPAAARHCRREHLLQQLAHLVHAGVLQIEHLHVRRRDLDALGVLLDDLVDLLEPLLRRRDDEHVGARVRHEAHHAGAPPASLGAEDALERRGELVDVLTRYLDGLDLDVLHLGRVEALDKVLNLLHLLRRGADDQTGPVRLEERRSVHLPSARAAPDKQDLAQTRHLHRVGVFELNDDRLDADDLRRVVEARRLNLDLLEIALACPHDQGVGDRIGDDLRTGRPAPREPPAAIGEHLLDQRRHLGRLGVLQRQDLELSLLARHVQLLDQRLDLLERRLERGHEQHVGLAIGGDRYRRAPQPAAEDVVQRLGEFLGVAVLDRDRLVDRVQAHDFAVKLLDRRIDLLPVLVVAHHDEDLAVLVRDHPQRARRSAPAHCRAAAEQRVQPLHHDRRPGFLELDDVRRGALRVCRVQLLDNLLGVLDVLRVAHDENRVALRVGNDLERSRGASPAGGHLPRLDDRVDQVENLVRPGVLQDHPLVRRFRAGRVELLHQRLDPLHPLLGCQDDQAIGNRFGLDVNALAIDLAPLPRRAHRRLRLEQRIEEHRQFLGAGVLELDEGRRRLAGDLGLLDLPDDRFDLAVPLGVGLHDERVAHRLQHHVHLFGLLGLRPDPRPAHRKHEVADDRFDRRRVRLFDLVELHLPLLLRVVRLRLEDRVLGHLEELPDIEGDARDLQAIRLAHRRGPDDIVRHGLLNVDDQIPEHLVLGRGIENRNPVVIRDLGFLEVLGLVELVRLRHVAVPIRHPSEHQVIVLLAGHPVARAQLGQQDVQLVHRLVVGQLARVDVGNAACRTARILANDRQPAEPAERIQHLFPRCPLETQKVFPLFRRKPRDRRDAR